MTIYNLGSINVDHFYSVPHLPQPGETLAACGYSTGLGGKGANQSVAAAKAGAQVIHIGAVGPDGGDVLDRLALLGVDTTHVEQVDTPTAHAIINIDPAGENAIVIFPGANEKQSLTRLELALKDAGKGDILLLQNETTLQVEAAQMARKKGLFTIYSAAPFAAEAVTPILPHIDLLVMNAVEAEQLTAALSVPLTDTPVPHLLITRGKAGATWRTQATGKDLHVPAFRVTPIDTTGAGDCYIGTVAAGLAENLCAEDAMRRAAAASAIQVTRKGTADAIPTRDEVDSFLSTHP
ncbi:ribokinase [Rhodalgimonas zhirmunskyi]|uniref:Ribokinase n=1 Tax=Rhodalgimonas zhirmunskyi TaxID=2964767 RepID=A0AAJ1X612_9RHOB|nr:ribokinase [Rhodoalgimonas zhirmunskyi]MDQ2094224.1 ribokinase [Rhodoalgimonas zhirmunskyi]